MEFPEVLLPADLFGSDLGQSRGSLCFFLVRSFFLVRRFLVRRSSLGSRQLAVATRRQGDQENAKRVLRLMRLDNLLRVRKKRYVLTTDSDHFLPVYPNLAPRLVVDGLNQL